MDEYWTRWLDRSRRRLSRAGLHPWGPAWASFGRLHYRRATGDIVSRPGAGGYARDAFDRRWHRIVDECLRLRRGEGGPSRYRDQWTRRRDALDVAGMVIAAIRLTGTGRTADRPGRTGP